jgi:UDP-N-acetylmuramoyl-tripeptide--D-alanyl-D-alanine ligase
MNLSAVFLFLSIQIIVTTMSVQELHQLFLSCSGVSTDSRNCPPKSIFFALKGEHFDGNKYALKALVAGASYAVVDNPDLKEKEGCIWVEDVLQTLQNLAAYHRQYLGLPVIAITGTNGKTTTKELIREVLSKKFNVLATSGNLNNHIGVPLTLLSLTPVHEMAIVEMGANHVGEIAALCEIADPDFGLITNVGKAHLEGFGSFEGVMQAKGELYQYLAKKAGVVFVNEDNKWLRSMLPGKLDKMAYSVNDDKALVWGQVVPGHFFMKLVWKNPIQSKEYAINTQLLGNYNLENALAAIVIGVYFMVDPEEVNAALEGYQPKNNRSQYVKTARNEVLMDAYNANPTSMQAALDNFKTIDGENKVLVLGGMKEMGENCVEEHQTLIERIKELQVKHVYLIGNEFTCIHMDLPNVIYFETVEGLMLHFNQHPLKDSKILVKGSRSNQLEKLLPVL